MVPRCVLDEVEITWPAAVDTVAPHEAVRQLAPDDVYRRHGIIAGELFLYLRASRSPTDVPH